MIVLIKPTFFGVLHVHVLLVRVLPVRVLLVRVLLVRVLLVRVLLVSVLLVRVLLVSVLQVQSSPLNTVGRGGVTILKECGKNLVNFSICKT